MDDFRINRMLREKRRRRQRRNRLIALTVIAAVIVTAVIVTLVVVLQPSQTPADTPSTPATITSPPETTTTSTEVPTTTQPPAPTETTTSPGADVSNEFFNDTAFIGDSRTEGLMLYTGLENAAFYTSKGLTVEQFFSKAVIKKGEDKVTIPAAMEGTSYKKVYIMLGLNELGWSYESVYVEKYGQLIDKVKELAPEATIYIQSVLPVTKEKSDSDAIFNNPKVNHYNELLQKLAADKGVRYLAVNESVGLDDGALPAEATTDGIHLNKSYCLKWLNYLKANP